MINRRYFSLIILSVALSISIFFFCGNPVQPDFSYPPEITDNTIKYTGTNIEGFEFIMYVLLEKQDESVTFQWIKNDAPISGMTNDSLVFPSLKLSDNGQYRCIASNGFGSDTTQIYSLSVTPNSSDSIKPLIQVISPPDSFISNKSSLPLTFKVTDESGVSWVTVNDCTITSMDSIYRDTIMLLSDTNFVTIIAADASVLVNKDTLKLIYFFDSTFVDTVKPVITLITPQDSSVTGDPRLPIRFKVTDNFAVSQVTVNDCTVLSPDSIYSDTVTLTEDTNTIVISARDINANLQSLLFTAIYDPSYTDSIPPVIKLVFPEDSSTSASESIEVQFLIKDKSGISSVSINSTEISSSDSIYKTAISLNPGINTVKAIATDASPNANKDSLTAIFYYDSTYLDTTPPTIVLNSPSQGTFTKNSMIEINVDVDDLSNIAWVTIAGDTVEPSKGNYIHTVSLTPGVNSIPVKAQDNSTNKNIDSITVKVVYDNQSPTLALLDPTVNNSTVGSSSKRIYVIAKDNFGITGVTFSMGTNSFPPTKQNDSTWYADITGLQADIFNNINIDAADSAANTTGIEVKIKYDPTIQDDQPPAMTQQSGPMHGDRVTTAKHTIQFTISDDNGVDSAYYTIDGIYAGNMTNVGNDLYECAIDLGTGYGDRIVVIYAVDGSTNQNQGYTTIQLVYNTVISAVSNVSPADSATDVSLQPVLKWSGGNDPDGDAVTFKVYYGTTSSTLDQVIAAGTDTTVQMPNALTESTHYFWKVTAYSGTYPEDSVSSSVTSFTTISVNDPPVLVSVTNQTTNEDTPIILTMEMVSAIDVDNAQDELSLIVGTGTNYSVNGTTVTPASNYYGSLTVPIKVFDGQDVSNTKNMTITINPVNDAPVLNSVNDQITDEDVAITLDMTMVTATDVDNTQGQLSLIVGNGSNYTVSGTTVTPDNNYDGTLTVPIKVYDGQDESNSLDMTININPVNDWPVLKTLLPDTIFNTNAGDKKHPWVDLPLMDYFEDIDNTVEDLDFGIDTVDYLDADNTPENIYVEYITSEGIIRIIKSEGDILCQLLFKKSKNSVFIIDKQFYCSLTFPDYRVFYFSS